MVEWEIEGVETTNCNCNQGCPCQFNSLPTHGHCRAHVWVQVDRGHFGDVSLDGTRFGVLAAWPGAVHQGNGTYQVIVDERGTAAQRDALEKIATGKETEFGAIVWTVFAAMSTTFLPTVVGRIDLEIDIEAREASVNVPGVVEGNIVPIRNPVTGLAHRARVTLPAGFEYHEAEYASGHATSQGQIDIDFKGTHAHLCRVHWSTHGVVR